MLNQATTATNNVGPRLLKVTDQVFVGHRYSISNIIYIITATSVVVVDTGETIAAARKSLEEFRRICALPISHIIYTHFHGDHTLGASAIYTAGTRVIAQRNLLEEYAKGQLLRPYRTRVDRLQFGLDLKKKFARRVAPKAWRKWICSPRHYFRLKLLLQGRRRQV